MYPSADPLAALEEPPGAGSRILALLPEEPAGRISTRNAGAVFFESTLAWRPGDGVPPDPLLREPRAPGARFYSLVTSAVTPATRRISCEIRALDAGRLAGALDEALRSVTTQATLTGAVLETRAIRLAAPKSPPAALVEKLARQLWEAGFPVSAGPSWSPAPGNADISVGVGGLEEALEAFLQEHCIWQAL